MKKAFVLFFIILSTSNCSNSGENLDILPYVRVEKTIDLSLPQYINLQVPGGWVDNIPEGVRGIVLYRIKSNEFKAFDRACPQNSCTTAMTFDGSIKLKCSCDKSEFSILDGSPQTNGVVNIAREYQVRIINSSILQISNF